MHRPRIAVALAALLTIALAPLARGQDADRWFEVWIDGSRSGWSHERVTSEDDRITTATETRMSMGRAGQVVEISTESVFVETRDGTPVEMRVRQQLGPVPVETVYTFREGEVLVRSEQVDGVRESVIPLPEGEWLTPAAAAAYLRQRLESGATEATLRTLDPTNGLSVVTVTRSPIEAAEFEALGRTVEGYRSTTRTKVGPVTIPATEWLDKEGTPLRTEMKLGAMGMTMIASSRERAMRTAAPAELMVSTFVKPDERISRPRSRRQATYTVRVPEGELQALPASAFQAAERLEQSAARVRVDLDGANAAGEVDRQEHLAATTYADTRDERIRELAAEALEGVPEDAAARAEALRRFVYRHIATKDLGVAFATASETARSGAGDCSEHGVLLAALLRAAGIPSRVAAGVVYVDEFAGERHVFGYHMWTQALLETEAGPAWIDLDATLDARTPFDATHIAFATSSLGEGDAVSALAAIAPLLGMLEIEVEEVR